MSRIFTFCLCLFAITISSAKSTLYAHNSQILDQGDPTQADPSDPTPPVISDPTDPPSDVAPSVEDYELQNGIDTSSKSIIITTLPVRVGTIAVGGDGFWDYLNIDSVTQKLYVSHSTKVVVIDLKTQKVLHEILNTSGVHGITFSDELHRGFISCGKDSSVTVFDTRNDSTIASIKPTGRNPDAILFDPYSKKVFTFNGGSHDASVIDAVNLTVIGTIPLSGKPEFAASDVKGRVFVNIEDKSVVAVIDVKTLKVKSEWSLAPCEEPSSMAIDRKHHRLFVGCHNRLMAVINYDNGHLITSETIGKGVDASWFDNKNQMVFCSCGDGTLSAILEKSPDEYEVAGTVNTEMGARTMALDERTHRLYLPAKPGMDSKTRTGGNFQILVYKQ